MQLIANGLTTVPTHELLNFIGDYIAKEPVERLIVGLPRQMNNEASENMKNIEPFVHLLRKAYQDTLYRLLKMCIRDRSSKSLAKRSSNTSPCSLNKIERPLKNT